MSADGARRARPSAIAPGRRAGAATRSTSPVCRALRGMESNWAVSGCWTAVSPPAACRARRPRVPSEPVPDSTTPAPRGPSTCATDSNMSSIGCRRPRGCNGTLTCRWPSFKVNVALGGITYTVFGHTRRPSSASHTGNRVARWSRCTSTVSRVGSRCCTTTQASPVPCVTWAKNASSAGRPPADAPMATRPTNAPWCGGIAGGRRPPLKAAATPADGAGSDG